MPPAGWMTFIQTQLVHRLIYLIDMLMTNWLTENIFIREQSKWHRAEFGFNFIVSVWHINRIWVTNVSIQNVFRKSLKHKVSFFYILHNLINFISEIVRVNWNISLSHTYNRRMFDPPNKSVVDKNFKMILFSGGYWVDLTLFYWNYCVDIVFMFSGGEVLDWNYKY